MRIKNKIDLQDDVCEVLYLLCMSDRNSALPNIFCCSSGTYVLDHLAADGAGLTGGQVAVVTIGQVDTDLGSCLHLELVHGLAGLGNVDLIVVLVAHLDSLLCFLRKKPLSEESIFFP